jgi:hypothetical protein
MRRKFIRTLVVVLAAIAVFVFICPDDLLGLDPAGPSVMVLQSPEKYPTHRNRSSRLAPLSKDIHSPKSEMGAIPLRFVFLSTSVLRC